MAKIRIHFQRVENANQTLRQALSELDEIQEQLKLIKDRRALEEGTADELQQELEAVTREATALNRRGMQILKLVKRAAGSYRAADARLRRGF